MKIKQPKLTWTWTIRINDGFVEYEYQLPAKNNAISINEVYDMVRIKLRARRRPGRKTWEPLTFTRRPHPAPESPQVTQGSTI